MSQDSLPLEFGLGPAASADSIVVSWPSGYVETYTGVLADRTLAIRELDVVAVGDAVPRGPAFAFAPPTPNPVRNTAVLSFAVPFPGRVRLAVYDLQGRLVKLLLDEVEPAGWHQVAWDRRDARGTRVAAGISISIAVLTEFAMKHNSCARW